VAQTSHLQPNWTTVKNSRLRSRPACPLFGGTRQHHDLAVPGVRCFVAEHNGASVEPEYLRVNQPSFTYTVSLPARSGLRCAAFKFRVLPVSGAVSIVCVAVQSRSGVSRGISPTTNRIIRPLWLESEFIEKPTPQQTSLGSRATIWLVRVRTRTQVRPGVAPPPAIGAFTAKAGVVPSIGSRLAAASTNVPGTTETSRPEYSALRAMRSLGLIPHPGVRPQKISVAIGRVRARVASIHPRSITGRRACPSPSRRPLRPRPSSC